MKERAREMRIGSAVGSRAGGGRGTKQMWADGDADGGSGGFGDGARDAIVGHWISIVG